MDMRKCNVCGEMYSTTYRTCPFCEEEAAIRRGRPLHRHASDFRNRKGGQALGIVALVAALILIGWCCVHFWGDNIAGLLGIREAAPPDEPDDVIQVDPDETTDPETPVDPDQPDDTTDSPPVTEAPETPVTLSSSDFTLFSAGETASLTASGGSGSYTWSCDNPQVATVSEAGEVTAVGNGTATVTVSDGFTTAACIVRVRGAEPSGETTPSGGGLTLSRTDFTLNSTWPTYTFTVTGASGAISWSTSDASVATVDANGTVTRVGSGTCTITATSGGQTATCVVRVA